MRIMCATTATPGAPHGYGIIAKRIPDYLDKYADGGIARNLQANVGDWDMVIMISQPIPWVIGCDRPDIIWHTMFEVTPFPRHWADILNRVRAVWAPSQWVKDELAAIGVSVPIFVVGYGVDCDIFYYAERPEKGPDDTLEFVAWARGIVSRKHVLAAMKAFLAADIPNARLTVKVNADDEVAFNSPTITWNGDIVSDTRLRIIAEDWSRRQIADWLRSADIGFYLSGGEGFGLMPLEAMATGLPLIAMPNTGMLDFMDASVCINVSGRKAPAHTYIARWGYESSWFVPDHDSVVEAIRWASNNRDKLADIGVRAHARASKYTWDSMARDVIANIEKL